MPDADIPMNSYQPQQDILRATQSYEAWLGERTPLIAPDVQSKHEQMRKDAFRFFRATFYRWIQHWNDGAGELRDAPQVHAVGDLHVSNFGTWRDAEGRMVWGVNDFDEAYPLPWTQDLVRLAVSAYLAIEQHELKVRPEQACDAILDGYSTALKAGGEPFVLAEKHDLLREIALNKVGAAPDFWRKLEELPEVKDTLPEAARRAIEQALPAAGLPCRFVHRLSGLGSRGRPRFVALAPWQGGLIAREAKALTPSACVWAQRDVPRQAHGEVHSNDSFTRALLESAVRAHDPMLAVSGEWIVRRLAPDCVRIGLKELPTRRDEEQLLRSMGYEAGNIHLGTPGAQSDVRRDLQARATGWLAEAAKAMTKWVVADWETWRK